MQGAAAAVEASRLQCSRYGASAADLTVPHGRSSSSRASGRMLGELALDAGVHVVELLDDELRLLGDRAAQLGVEQVVARA